MGNLKIENALRKERYDNKNWYYVFKCETCSNEIRPGSTRVNNHSGLCKVCTRHKNPHKALYNGFKSAVFRKNLEGCKHKDFYLTFEEFLEFTEIKTCHYCNDDIYWSKYSGDKNNRYNLDRMDSSIGYTKDNCVVCCKRCNYMKGSEFTYNEFKEVVNLLNTLRNGEFIK
jgi:hypothetical protein